MALTQITEKGVKDGELVNADINASAAIAGSKLAASTTSVAGSMSAADKTKLDGIAASANNYTHPNHSGDVTSSADGATTIADNAVTLAKMAGGTDGQIITYDANGDPVAVGPGTDGQVLTSTGAGSPPAFETLPTSGAALTGSTNNTITTVTGANAIQGEANLTYDGTTLKNQVAAENGTIAQFELSGQTNNPALLIKADESDQQITFRAGSSTSTYPSIAFDMGTVGDAFTIAANGRVGVGASTPAENFHINSGGASCIQRFQTSSYDSYIATVHTAGNLSNNSVAGQLFLRGQNGIGFSANAGGASQVKITSDGLCFGSDTAAANALDDYEEGDYTPTDNSGASLSFTYTNTGKYTKIGRLVTCQFDITFPTTSSSSVAVVSLPFSGGLSYGGGVSNWNSATHPAFIHVTGSDAYIMDVDSSRGHSSAHMLNSECSGKRFACNFWYHV